MMYPNTSPVEENVAGNGALGPFTFRNVTADETSPPSQPPSTCSGSTHLYLPRVAGAGIFRFQDGSLLNVKLIQGSDCRSEEHTSELQSPDHLVCRMLLENKKKKL